MPTSIESGSAASAAKTKAPKKPSMVAGAPAAPASAVGTTDPMWWSAGWDLNNQQAWMTSMWQSWNTLAWLPWNMVVSAWQVADAQREALHSVPRGMLHSVLGQAQQSTSAKQDG